MSLSTCPTIRVSVGRDDVDLTPKEFAFLALLARYPGRVLTHRTILQDVWGPEYGSETQYSPRVREPAAQKSFGMTPAPRLITEPGWACRLVDRAALA